MGINFALGNNLSYDEAEPVCLKALELGCTFWDTAVSYRAEVNAKLLGDFIRKYNCRDKFPLSQNSVWLFFEDGDITNKAAHIKGYIDGTIERLSFAPDLEYLHHIDPDTQLEEFISVLDSLRTEDKAKHIGLSECFADTLRKANSILYTPSCISLAKIHSFYSSRISRDMDLTKEEVEEMCATISKLKPQGERYSEEAAKTIEN